MIPELAFKLFDFKLFEVLKSKSVTDEDIEAYKYTFSQADAIRGPINYYRANARFFTKLPYVQRPTNFAKGLYVLGEKDIYISKRSGKLLQKYYDNLEFKIMKNTQHFLQQENPEETNEFIRDFLNSE